MKKAETDAHGQRIERRWGESANVFNDLIRAGEAVDGGN
jgi:hypothetical protein